jgi:type VI secretion system protein ImpG
MDPRLLRYYNQELAYLREMGAEFARQFPKIAGRLGIEGLEVSDPYIERLLEGSAFLTARLQYKIDSEFERFTQRLLEIVYPNFLAPVPSMMVARFDPDVTDGNLARGVEVPRGTLLRSHVPSGESTACEFSTAQDVVLYPLQVLEAKYFSFAPDLPLTRHRAGNLARGGVRLRLRTGGGLKPSQLNLDELTLTLAGAEEAAYKLFEQATTAYIGGFVVPYERPVTQMHELPEEALTARGADDEDALLPADMTTFQGYRLLQEYFAFPQRFLNLRVRGLRQALAKVDTQDFELVLLFGTANPSLEPLIDASMFALFATPAINLRERRADRISINDASHEFHCLVDRTRPMDFEVFGITGVQGFGTSGEATTEYLPLYKNYHAESVEYSAYYTMRREQRLLSAGQRKTGPRSSYIGTEVFVALVDQKEAPHPQDLKQLALTVLATNRDLPVFMPVGQGSSDFSMEIAAPVKAIRVIRGPSRPLAPAAQGSLSWKLISHLSLNYLSLLNTDEREGAAALREMLRLYLTGNDTGAMRQIDGVKAVRSTATVRRLPMDGPLAFARGSRIEVEVDDMAFQGGSAYLLGCVLERFFARHASANSFTETLMRSQQRGQIARWVPRCGTRPIV